MRSIYTYIKYVYTQLLTTMLIHINIVVNIVQNIKCEHALGSLFLKKKCRRVACASGEDQPADWTRESQKITFSDLVSKCDAMQTNKK